MSEDDVISLDELVESRAYYSFSQINAYIRCPYQYGFRYILGHKIPPASALLFGSTTHSALEGNFRQKVESHQDIKIEDIKMLWASKWDENISKNADILYAEDENKTSMLDEGVKLITEYHKLVSPTIQPVAVEEKFDDLRIEGIDKPIIGVIDLIDNKDVVIDHKTSKRSPAVATLNKDIQLSCYSFAYLNKYKTLPLGLRFDYLVRTKKPSYPQFAQTRTMVDIEGFKETVRRIVRAIESGIFFPNHHNYMCSPDACGYWRLCEAGRVKVNL